MDRQKQKENDTFITGSEDEIERKRNKEAFNDVSNKLGDQIQIMIISGAGAEGISLAILSSHHGTLLNYGELIKCLDVTIRLGSPFRFTSQERTVEQYMYLVISRYFDSKSCKCWKTREL